MKRCYYCMNEVLDKTDICPHCGEKYVSIAKEDYQLPPGSLLLDRYVIGVAFDHRGESIHYIGYDKLLEQRVVVKEYFPIEYVTRNIQSVSVALYADGLDDSYNEGLRHFLGEARVLAKFREYKSIMHIMDVFEGNGTAYQIIEDIHGITLAALLSEKGRLSVSETQKMLEPMAEVLQKIHEEGVIHRNISPDTIMLTDSGDVKLIDFGAARHTTADATKSLSVMIIPGFTPEEQYMSSGNQGAWTDVYALAATFYKCVTGITPEDSVMRSMDDVLKRPSEYGIVIEESIEKAVMHALKPDVTERTLTMNEFLLELNSADRQSSPSKHLPPPKLFAVSACLVWVLGMGVALRQINRRMQPEFRVQEKADKVLPDFTGSSYESAKMECEKEGIKLIRQGTISTDKSLKGCILSQDVEDGTVLKSGMTIRVWVAEPKVTTEASTTEADSHEVTAATMETTEETVTTQAVSRISNRTESTKKNTTDKKGTQSKKKNTDKKTEKTTQEKTTQEKTTQETKTEEITEEVIVIED